MDWRPDVVVLDLGQPDLDGTDVLNMIRSVSTVPVVVATARDADAEIVGALDLSHRLRTPLAALRLDAESHGSAALIADVDRLQAEVSEVIRAARRPLHESMALHCDLAAVVEGRAAFWGAVADDDGRTWSCSVTPSGPHDVRLSEADAAAAVDVLLENVFAHTPDAAPYAVSVVRRGDRVELAVDDGGPGMGGAVVGRGASGGGSTGLGLDIATSAARSAGGDLRVERSALGGARIVLALPRTQEPG